MAKKLENKPFFPNWFQCNSYTKTIHETLVFMRCSGFSVTFLQSSQTRNRNLKRKHNQSIRNTMFIMRTFFDMIFA